MSNNNDESSPAVMELSASSTGAEVGSTNALKAGVVDDTSEYDLALLEEVGNYNTHIPEPKEKTKNFESVTVALMNRRIPFKNPRTIMERFGHLKRMHGMKMSKQQSISGVENFGDDDPVAELMEDLIQKINDHEALKDGKKNEKQNKEVQLVAGEKALCEKCCANSQWESKSHWWRCSCSI
jgi:hypothetical protein